MKKLENTAFEEEKSTFESPGGRVDLDLHGNGSVAQESEPRA